MKTVSIIIPVYNAEAYIKQCFANICNQTYTHSAIECIFIDDGSKDNSSSLIKNLITKDDSNITFQLITHEHNQGVSVARNTGIKAAKNDYLFFMDVDDNISADCIHLLVKATSDYPEANIIVGNLLNKKEDTCHHTKEAVICRNGCHQNLHDTLLFIYTSFPVNKLIARKFVLDNHLFFPVGIPYFEDLQWIIDVVQLCDKIVYLPQLTYFYEYVDSSTMSHSQQKPKTLAECYLSLIRKVTALDTPPCAIEKHLFIHFYICKLMNMKHRVNSKEDVAFFRKGLIRQSINLRKPLLFLYDLLLFRPFYMITQLKVYRSHSAELRLWICDRCNNNDTYFL